MVDAADSDTLIIQFAKVPVAGTVKTRMLPQLSAEQACELHQELTQWTNACVSEAAVGVVWLAVAGDDTHPFLSSLKHQRLHLQRGADLGERMYNALLLGLQDYANVLLVGSDCPFIDEAYLRAARGALDQDDVVLGPALDGGYVMIGVKRVKQEWFSGVSWGGGKVLEQTRQRLKSTHSGWRELSALPDIDRPEDLPRWRALQNSAPQSAI